MTWNIIGNAPIPPKEKLSIRERIYQSLITFLGETESCHCHLTIRDLLYEIPGEIQFRIVGRIQQYTQPEYKRCILCNTKMRRIDRQADTFPYSCNNCGGQCTGQFNADGQENCEC